jgi:hypothetical protein
MRASTSASQASGSMPLSLAVEISVIMAAARSAPRSEPATTITCAPGQSHGHSAHTGQDGVIHYPWHPLFGRSARRIMGEQRAIGAFVVSIRRRPPCCACRI